MTDELLPAAALGAAPPGSEPEVDDAAARDAAVGAEGTGAPADPVPAGTGSALMRPFSLAWCLPGFMREEELLRHVPSLEGLPAGAVAELRRRLGAAAALGPAAAAGAPSFRRVTEAGVLALLEQVAPQMNQASLDNQVGFEWVEIAPTIAGRLTTGGEPSPDAIPDVLDAVGVARLCLQSFGKLPALHSSPPGGVPQITVPVHAELKLAGHQLIAEHGLLVVQYVVQPSVDPIRIAVIDGRTIALTGLERLITLRRRGVTHALCAVSYGYGQDVFHAPPTVDAAVLLGSRPPLISDFDDPRVAAPIPVRSPLTVMTLSAQTLRS